MSTPSDSAISENISEKRKRGRPAEYSPEAYRLAKSVTDALTRRSQQNCLNQMRCQKVLYHSGREAEFKWLFDRAAVMAGTARIKRTIVSELGRIPGDGQLLEVATMVCQRKMRTGQALAFIRRSRLGEKPADTDSLADCLIAALNSYLARRPDTSTAQIQAALRIVTLGVEQMEAAQP